MKQEIMREEKITSKYITWEFDGIKGVGTNILEMYKNSV